MAMDDRLTALLDDLAAPRSWPGPIARAACGARLAGRCERRATGGVSATPRASWTCRWTSRDRRAAGGGPGGGRPAARAAGSSSAAAKS